MNEPIKPIYWDSEDDCLVILDQRKLPENVVWLRIKTLDELEDAIIKMAIRGAPLLGVAAAFGVYIGIKDFEGSKEGFNALFENTLKRIASTRPTAVNLFAALGRAQEVVNIVADADLGELKAAIFEMANAILKEEEEKSYSIARNGARLIEFGSKILTHCNTGALAVGGIGTALGVVYQAFKDGKVDMVYVDETRPLLQGARLTAWELSSWGIPHRVIVDSAAASLMMKGDVNYVLVGADRIARNGDVANKIGTLSLAVAAHTFEVPFIVAAPLSSFDLSAADGTRIKIEERDEEEVLTCGGRRIAPKSSKAYNPAFDVTPARFVTAIVTEKGLIEKPDKGKISEHVAKR